jgi:hypothetical protein
MPRTAFGTLGGPPSVSNSGVGCRTARPAVPSSARVAPTMIPRVHRIGIGSKYPTTNRIMPRTITMPPASPAWNVSTAWLKLGATAPRRRGWCGPGPPSPLGLRRRKCVQLDGAMGVRHCRPRAGRGWCPMIMRWGVVAGNPAFPATTPGSTEPAEVPRLARWVPLS